MEDMIQIKLAVEGMKAEIIKCFDVAQISKHIREATEKAVTDFDMAKFIKDTVDSVFFCAREKAIEGLSQEYGSKWAVDIERIVDDKIKESLS